MISTKSRQMVHHRADPSWRVIVGFVGKIAFVKSYPAKVFAEAEAKRLRLQYPDRRAEFWVSRATLRCGAKWATIERQLSQAGEATAIFGASSRYASDRRVMATVRDAIHDAIAQRRVEPGFAALPYTVRELMDHISAQFRPGMSWGNYGSEWVIDHIRPRAAFDMREPSQLAECWALSNLQPLWAAENIAKSASDKRRIRAA